MKIPIIIEKKYDKFWQWALMQLWEKKMYIRKESEYARLFTKHHLNKIVEAISIKIIKKSDICHHYLTIFFDVPVSVRHS